LTLIQQADNLPLGDEDAERLQHLHKSRHGDLPLVILRQNKPAQFRSEVPFNAVRQRSRQQGAIRSHPALAAKFHDVSAQDQILDKVTGVALETRAGWGGDLDGLLFVDCQLRSGRPALGTISGRAIRFWLGRLLHAARLDNWPARATLQAGDLVALRGHCSLQLRHPLK
jgi:hypothetical protein